MCPGSCHDSVAYAHSDIPERVAELPGLYHIVADAAYPESEKVLCPFPGRGLQTYDDSFNYHQSQVRMSIERAFGICVARWGILWRPLRTTLETSIRIIRACMLLHTFCLSELSETDAAIPSGMFDAQGRLSCDYRTSSDSQGTPSPTGVCVMREMIREQLEQRQQRRPAFYLQ